MIRGAERHFAAFRRSDHKHVEPISRWSTLLNLFSFVRRNPGVALRGVNRHRLRKLKGVLIDGNTSSVETWLQERLSPNSAQAGRPLRVPAVDSAEQLEFPVPPQPAVSIIVPVYNQYETTLACLRCILAHTEAGYELIVTDDCSEDDTATIARRIRGIAHVKTPHSLGFLGNCNHAAARARGDYLVFLNNNTNVQPGWLAALLQVFAEHPDAGVVGPQLRFKGGHLKDAGGIVWKDGSVWSFGQSRNHEAPEYNYLRDVDYVSGACLATRVDLWRRTGGFDPTFAPASCEDADYCFSVREAGFRVLYQPQSVVVHEEGVPHGVDLGPDAEVQQLHNRRIFRKKWANTLAALHFDNGEHLFLARDRSRDRTTVLVIDHYIPRFDQDAGSRSTYQYLQQMVRRGMNVKFIGANFFPHQPYTRALQSLGIEVLAGPEFASSWRGWLRANGRYLDVVCLYRPHVAEQFLAELKDLSPQPRLVYFGVDLHHLRVSREARLKKSRKRAREADNWKRREIEICRQVDQICFPSQVEIDEIRKELPDADVRLIPLYVLDDAKPASSYQHAERKDILFVGGFDHPPNEDAMLWFTEEVFPQLCADIPDLRLHIVGPHPSPRVRQLSSSSVIVHGFLSDAELRELYGQVRVVVVPVRFGAGVKGKVLEALNYAVPIVTTPVGAEGLPEATLVMRVAGTPQSFCTSVRELYCDPAKAERYLNQYHAYIHRWFGDEAVTAFLEKAVMPGTTTGYTGDVLRGPDPATS